MRKVLHHIGLSKLSNASYEEYLKELSPEAAQRRRELFNRLQPGDVIVDYTPASDVRDQIRGIHGTDDPWLNRARLVMDFSIGSANHARLVVDPSTDKALDLMNTGLKERNLARSLGSDHYQVLRPKGLSPEQIQDVIHKGYELKGAAPTYGGKRAVLAGVGQMFPGSSYITNLIANLRKKDPSCVGPICSSFIADLYADKGLRVRAGVPSGQVLPGDFLSSRDFELIGDTGGEAFRPLLGRNAPLPRRLLGYAAPVAAAYGIGDAMHRGPEERARREKRKNSPAQQKTSEVTTELQPHQARILRRIMENPGLVVAHGLGSGKSLSSIAAGEAMEGDVTVLVPAALQQNYQKELDKHTRDRKSRFNVDSLQRAGVKGDIAPGKMLIIDEAHRLREPSSKTRQLVRRKAEEYDKRLLLSATPVYNRPHDIASLVNIAAAENVLPGDTSEFNRRYLRSVPVPPGFFASLVGVKPGVREELANKAELRKIFRQWVDYHANSTEGFPTRIEEVIQVPMTPEQSEVYQGVMGDAPAWLRHKVKKGLPPSKQESKDLNAFLGAARQVSLTPKGFSENMSDEEILANSPKIREAATRFEKGLRENPDHKAVVYSNYLDSLGLYQQLLQEKGIPYGVFTGDENKKLRDQAVRDFNEGKLKALFVSSAGGEGLDLKGTRQIQVLEPHWNDEKLEQVIGRGIRYGSHAALPEDQRNVRVEKYLATMPERRGLGRLLFGKSRGGAADAYLNQLSEEKKALNNQVLELLMQGTADWERTHPEKVSSVNAMLALGGVGLGALHGAAFGNPVPTRDGFVPLPGQRDERGELRPGKAALLGLPMSVTPWVFSAINQAESYDRARRAIKREVETAAQMEAEARALAAKGSDPRVVELLGFLEKRHQALRDLAGPESPPWGKIHRQATGRALSFGGAVGATAALVTAYRKRQERAQANQQLLDDLLGEGPTEAA